jgi:hypothetical protein
MQQWTKQRKIAFWFHVIVVAIPFTISAVSAWLFWYNLFQSGWIATAMVIVVDVLALSGLVLYIYRIESPFVALRHALPFISIIPLGLELYGLLADRGWVAYPVAIIATAILVAVAWQCFATIERLFISPLEAARERAREQAQALTLSLAQLREYESVADEFALERLQYRMPQMTLATLEPESNGAVTALSKTARVKALAAERGESVSTVWRKVRSGEITIEDA